MTTRLRTAAPALRLGAAGLLLAAALPLSACGFPFSPYGGGAVRVDGGGGTPTPAPTDTTTDDSSASGTLTFDADSLPAGGHVEWSDGLIADSRWKVDKPDDGNGNWSYATVDGLCTVQFWQGTTTSTGAKDDREASDLMLAALTKATIADVTAAASDVPFKNATSGGYDVDSRAVQGSNDAATWVIQARVFEQAGAGLSFVLDCTDGSAPTVADEIIEKDPILVH
ncbi:hypothetical protein [Microbacterium azadirachtae]|uniref:Lipoprotein n=1 Tax=Microbacterium azadirachtae TaxID=582680 RepID=A0A1I6HXU0_9MICO|nr:hypothetical protein [Microbacterium azadirachtae]SFR59040.1 hypothetical protein SAMN04488591_2237 [Microbacterium azadirachtae]